MFNPNTIAQHPQAQAFAHAQSHADRFGDHDQKNAGPSEHGAQLAHLPHVDHIFENRSTVNSRQMQDYD